MTFAMIHSQSKQDDHRWSLPPRRILFRCFTWAFFSWCLVWVGSATSQDANPSVPQEPHQEQATESTEGGAANDESKAQDSAEMLIIVGAGGGEKYSSMFSDAATQLQDFAIAHRFSVQTLGLSDPTAATDLEDLQNSLGAINSKSDSSLWLILIGHGTFDGSVARFNLRGPDLSSQQLAEWLAEIERPLIVVNCSSASAPFMNAVSGTNRIVITSTKNGFEQNFSYFAKHFVDALGSIDADLDKDDQTSLLESFLYASARVAEYYESEDRLVTEHALIDDNGDKLGTPPDWFEGIRVVKRDKEAKLPDGPRAHQIYIAPSERERSLTMAQRAVRNRLELEIEQLRLERNAMPEDEYLQKLEPIVIQLAELYESIDGESDSATESTIEAGEVHLPLSDVRAPRPTPAPDNE